MREDSSRFYWVDSFLKYARFVWKLDGEYGCIVCSKELPLRWSFRDEIHSWILTKNTYPRTESKKKKKKAPKGGAKRGGPGGGGNHSPFFL